ILIMNPWRFIIDPPREGGLNMAIDQALLLGAEQVPEAPRTVLRIYRWSIPTLSLGYAQKPEETANLDFCRHERVPLVRRPTGGRAVLHDMELTYSVVSNDPQWFRLKSSMEIYRQIAQAIQRGLEEIGLSLSLSGGAERMQRPMRGPVESNYLRLRVPCFTSSARYELLWGGKKMIGSAQRRLRLAFLQHGSLLLDCNFPLLAAVTRADESYLRASITTVRAERDDAITEEAVTAGLRVGFAEHFGITLDESALSASERARAEELADSYRIRT